MYVVALLSYVNGDGIGDLMHLIDIYHALTKNPTVKSLRVVPVICCADARHVIVEEKLQEAGISRYFLHTKEEYAGVKKEELQYLFNKTQQVIQVSYSAPFILPRDYSFPEGTLFKYIGEHESRSVFSPFKGFCSNASGYDFTMGLSTPYGIKISEKPVQVVSAAEVFSGDTPALMAQDALLHQRLLEETGSSGPAYFSAHNVMYPAYFNNVDGLFSFIYFLGITQRTSDKDIALLLSGKKMRGMDAKWQDFLRARDTRSLFQYRVVFCNGSKAALRSSSPAESTDASDTEVSSTPRIIRVFYGVELAPDRYHTLYQQAEIAGVSGDNTFEKAVSCHALPFYCSTNLRMKEPTLLALANIMRDSSACSSIPSDVRNDFLTYFSNFFCFIQGRAPDITRALLDESDDDPDFSEVDAVFSQLKIDAMVRYWPIVAEHLRQHHNFYNKLPAIVLQTRPNQPVVDETSIFPGIKATMMSYYLASSGGLMVALAIVLQAAGYSVEVYGSIATVGVATLLSAFGLFESHITQQVTRCRSVYTAEEALCQALRDESSLDHAKDSAVSVTLTTMGAARLH